MQQARPWIAVFLLVGEMRRRLFGLVFIFFFPILIQCEDHFLNFSKGVCVESVLMFSCSKETLFSNITVSESNFFFFIASPLVTFLYIPLPCSITSQVCFWDYTQYYPKPICFHSLHSSLWFCNSAKLNLIISFCWFLLGGCCSTFFIIIKWSVTLLPFFQKIQLFRISQGR